MQGAGAAVFTDAAAVEVPDALVEGINVCLEEACDTFRRSIRRAVLNYVLLDKGQRVRLGESDAVHTTTTTTLSICLYLPIDPATVLG